MKNNKNVNKTDVELDNLEFFNTDEFNKFMSNLLNQDTLAPKTRESVFNKIGSFEKIYKDLKGIMGTATTSNETQIRINSLLIENSIPNIETLKDYIDNELLAISNIINDKIDQLGVSVVDYFSYADDEIRQRVEEISNSTTNKIAQTEAELEVLTNALSNNADFVESEIERKTEKLGTEIQSMTNKLSPSTSLTVIKPSFSKILKRILNERAISKKNYKFAPKTIKSTYPTPKSYFRCLFEAYYEYNDAKQLSKDNSDNNIQMQILKKRQTNQELHEYLLALQNKENMELGKSKYQSNLALEVLPALSKLVNVDNSIKFDTSSPNFNIKSKNENCYKELLDKISEYLPNSLSKPTLKVINTTPKQEASIDEIKTSLDSQNTEITVSNITDVIKDEQPTTSSIEITSAVESEIVPENIDIKPVTETTSDISFGNTTSSIENSHVDQAEIVSENIDIKPITETTSGISFGNVDSSSAQNEIIDESSAVEATTSSEIDETILENAQDISLTDDTTSTEDINISEETITNVGNDIKLVENFEQSTNKNLQVQTSISKANHTSKDTSISKEDLEKIRTKAQQKLQKAQEQYDKVTYKAQEKLERAKATAELEIKKIKDQAIEMLQIAIDTANGIIDNANIESENILNNAMTSSTEVISIANQKSRNVLETAEKASNDLIEKAKTAVENIKKEATEKCKSLISTAEEKSNSIIINANNEADELMSNSKAESDNLLNSIDTKIKETKDEILRLKELIINDKKQIINCTENQKVLAQKIKKVEQLRVAATNIGVEDEINNLTQKLNEYFVEIKNSKKAVVLAKENIQKSHETIIELNNQLPTLRSTLEEKAKNILANAKQKANELLENSRKEAKMLKEKAKQDVKDLTEKTNIDIKSIIENSEIEARNIKENAKAESIEIIKNANSSSKSILDTAQVKSEELKVKAQEKAELLKSSKKVELEFILTDEDFEKVC